MVSNSPYVLAIVGPTCTGKSALAIELARIVGGEIINADSMQVYKHFDIGTAKPDATVRTEIPHYLIDVVEPFEVFNAARYRVMAGDAIGHIWAHKKLPIIVGGTGLYVRALLYGLFEVPNDSSLRESLKKDFELNPLRTYEMLKSIDPVYAMKISFRDGIRVVRALEVFYLTGKTMSEWATIHGFKETQYNLCIIGLNKPRELLYDRINQRVDDMLAQGWIDEVKNLAATYPITLKPFSSIGYREILLYFKGVIEYEDMVKDIKKFTRHYAKRQITWFTKEKNIVWYEYPEERNKMITHVMEFLKTWN